MSLQAYEAWGSLLLAAAGDKKARAVDDDAGIMLSHLGYSTTANYFYSPEGAKGTATSTSFRAISHACFQLPHHTTHARAVTPACSTSGPR